MYVGLPSEAANMVSSQAKAVRKSKQGLCGFYFLKKKCMCFRVYVWMCVFMMYGCVCVYVGVYVWVCVFMMYGCVCVVMGVRVSVCIGVFVHLESGMVIPL